MVQMTSKGAQKMQNHTEQVPKPQKKNRFRHYKKNIFGVGFSKGKAQAHSELSWGPYLSIYIKMNVCVCVSTWRLQLLARLFVLGCSKKKNPRANTDKDGLYLWLGSM